MSRAPGPAVAGLLLLLLPAAGPADEAPDLEPIPTFYAEPGLSPNREYVNQQYSEHIDPFTGKLQLHYTDLFIPGNGGFDLKIGRSYSSLDERLGEPSPWGVGWTMHFGRILRRAPTLPCATQLGPQLNPVFEASDGSRQVLYEGFPGDASYFITTSRWRAECLDGTGLLLRAPDGTRYEMNVQGPPVGNPAFPQNSWYPSRIEDRNGNWMQITYVASALFLAIDQVTTSDGRMVDFEYQGPGGPLARITDGSRTWSYEYAPVPNTTSHHFLKKAIRPDGTSWSYEYNETLTEAPGSYSLRRLTHPTGGSFDYTYQFVFPYSDANMPRATAIATKSGDGGLWTFAFRPASRFYEEGGQDPTMFDETVVTGPDGATTFWHFGYRSARPGSAWAIGLLVQKKVGNGEFEEAFDIGGTPISPQTNQRPGALFVFDNEVNTPQRFGHFLGRDGATYATEFWDHDEYGNPREILEQGPGLDGVSSRQTTLTWFVRPERWILGVRKDEAIHGAGAISRTFDDNANLLLEDRFGVATTYTHTSEGDRASRTDARQVKTTYSGYFRGLPTLEQQPEGVVVTREVSPAGNVEAETDGEDQTTEWDFDGLGRLTAVRHPVGNPVAVTWTATSRKLTRGSYQEVAQFDLFGRVKSVTATDTETGSSILQTFRYDSLGRRTFASYPNGGDVGTAWEYDVLGRPRVVKHAFRDGGLFDASREITYRPSAVAVKNERGLTTEQIYRAFGDPAGQELVLVHPPDPALDLAIERNLRGQIVTATQAGLTRTFHYDSRFFLDWSVGPEVGRTDFGRDPVGNMISRQVQGGPLVQFEYDGRNRLRRATYPEGDRNLGREYFRDDELQSVDNGFARREFLYDGNKNLIQEALKLPGREYTVQYAFDGNDALASITHGISGKTVDYAPDAFGRPTKAGTYVSAVLHHPTGELKAMTYANGVTTAVDLDPRRRPDELVVSGAASLFKLTYAYDGVGNVASIQDGVDGSLGRSLGYDAVDRLTGASGPWGAGSLAYDARGNIMSQAFSGWNLAYAYDAKNRLQSVSGARSALYSYDVQGNRIGDGTTAFGFDSASLLRCARCGQPDEIRYEYDGAGQRVLQVVNGVTTYFMHGRGGTLHFEHTPGSALKEFFYLGGQQVVVRETHP